MLIQHRLPGCEVEAVHAVRAAVFQNEQGISSSSDFDGLDATAEQFLAFVAGVQVGTARYRVMPDGVAKVERVAVLQEQRGRMVGQAIMNAIEFTAWRQGIQTLQLDAQLRATNFYERLGYQRKSDVFDEEGLPHIRMALNVRNPQIAQDHYGPFDEPYTYVDIYPHPMLTGTPLTRPTRGIAF